MKKQMSLSTFMLRRSLAGIKEKALERSYQDALKASEEDSALIKIIRIADAAYPDGLVMRYFTHSKTDHGDTLAKFIALEIRDVQDPGASFQDQLAEASRAMTSASHEVEAVAAAFEKKKGAGPASLQKIIQIADKVYPDGLVMEYFTRPRKAGGDTLAQFIAKEIPSLYGEDSFTNQAAEMSRGMKVAGRQLRAVANALQDAGAHGVTRRQLSHFRRETLKVMKSTSRGLSRAAGISRRRMSGF